jgi:hypothetical protein
MKSEQVIKERLQQSTRLDLRSDDSMDYQCYMQFFKLVFSFSFG